MVIFINYIILIILFFKSKRHDFPSFTKASSSESVLSPRVKKMFNLIEEKLVEFSDKCVGVQKNSESSLLSKFEKTIQKLTTDMQTLKKNCEQQIELNSSNALVLKLKSKLELYEVEMKRITDENKKYKKIIQELEVNMEDLTFQRTVEKKYVVDKGRENNYLKMALNEKSLNETQNITKEEKSLNAGNKLHDKKELSPIKVNNKNVSFFKENKENLTKQEYDQKIRIISLTTQIKELKKELLNSKHLSSFEEKNQFLSILKESVEEVKKKIQFRRPKSVSIINNVEFFKLDESFKNIGLQNFHSSDKILIFQKFFFNPKIMEALEKIIMNPMFQEGCNVIFQFVIFSLVK